MRKRKTFVAIALLIAVLFLGIGYAAITDTLNITGTATAAPDDDNFNVRFAEGNPEVSDEDLVTATRTDDLNATITVTGLKTVGETATATYTIQNDSLDLSANLSASVTNADETLFDVSYDLEKTTLAAKGNGEADTTTITVTVKLIKSVVEDTSETKIGVTIKADAVQN